MKLYLLVVYFMALMFVSVVGGAAQAQVAQDHSPVRLVTENLAPYNFIDDGTVAGLSTEIVRAMFERVGRRHEIEVMPWSRALETVARTPDMFIYSIARTAEREEGFAWVAPLVPLTLTVYRLRTRPELEASSLEEVRSKGRIVVIANDASSMHLRSLGFGDDNLLVLNDAGTGQRTSPLVINRRAEYLLANPFTIAQRIKTGQLEDVFTPVLDLPVNLSLFLAANPSSDPALVRSLADAHSALVAEGVVQRIHAAWRD